MRTVKYEMVCVNCGHPASHHGPAICTYDIGWSINRGGGLFGLMQPKVSEDMRQCECIRWIGENRVTEHETPFEEPNDC